MSDSTTAALRSARPTLQVSGVDDQALADRLVSLEIHDHREGLSRCELRLWNWGPRGDSPGFLSFDRKQLDFGRPLQVRFGQASLFEGRILGIEASFPRRSAPTLTILAEDRLQDLRMRRRTRGFPNASAADIAWQIAQEHGLRADVDLPGPRFGFSAQVNQSDLAFLREKVAAAGGSLWLESGRLRVAARGGNSSLACRLSHGRELEEFTVLADLAGQRTHVVAQGWDSQRKTALRHEVDGAGLPGKLDGPQTGPKILEAALGRRVETLAHTTCATEDEARADAEGYFTRMARQFITGRGRSAGDPRIQVGRALELLQLGPLFSGVYEVVAVTHRVDDQHAFSTEFAVERAQLGETP